MIARLRRSAAASTPAFDWHRTQSILVVKLDAIGDFVLATAFLRELRRVAPKADITLIVNPVVYNLAETCPHVDRVLQVDSRPKVERGWQLRRELRLVQFARRNLRFRRVDTAVIPRRCIDLYHATQLAVYSGAQQIIAYSEAATDFKRTHNAGYDAMVSHAVLPRHVGEHEAESMLALLRSFGATPVSTALELWLRADDRAFAASQLTPGRRHVAIGTGAAVSSRCWPVERYAAIGEWLRESHGLHPILVGSAGDPSVPGWASLLGATTLRQAAAVLESCALFVGNDSGLKHVAAAMRTPVVEVSGFSPLGPADHNNNPARFHAWGVSHRVVQPRIARTLLDIRGVSIDDVKAAICDLLAEPEGAS